MYTNRDVVAHLQPMTKPQLMLALKAKPRRDLEQKKASKQAVIDAVRSWTPDEMRANVKVRVMRDSIGAVVSKRSTSGAVGASVAATATAATIPAVRTTATGTRARVAPTASVAKTPRHATSPAPVETKMSDAGAHTLTVLDLEATTLANRDYRRVVATGTRREQLVLMSLRPGQEIGMEVHRDVDQFIRIERGTGTASTPTASYAIRDGSAVMVPAGTYHNIVNTGRVAMKLYTIYAPPNHPPGTVEHLKPVED